LKLLHVNPAINVLLLAHSRQIRALHLLLIGIYVIMGCNVQLRKVVLLLVGFEDELAHEDQQEWGTQITYALDVATGRMPHSPCEQEPCHHALHLIGLEDGDLWLRPEHIDLDLLEIPLLEV